MVGSNKEVSLDIENTVRRLIALCREEKVIELEIENMTSPDTHALFSVRLKLHELAIKATGVSQSTHPQPRKSNSPASPDATEEKLRFGSGSP